MGLRQEFIEKCIPVEIVKFINIFFDEAHLFAHFYVSEICGASRKQLLQ